MLEKGFMKMVGDDCGKCNCGADFQPTDRACRLKTGTTEEKTGRETRQSPPWYNGGRNRERGRSRRLLRIARHEEREVFMATNLTPSVWFAALAGLLLSGSVPAGDAPAASKEDKSFDVKVVADIDYYKGKDADRIKHKLDLYLPRGRKHFPVLFFVHGGAWRSGDKNYFGVYSALGKFYAQHGIGTVVTNYRLSPKVKHPEHIRDVARAFAWTARNISKYGGRPDALFLCGHSAGGHLVSLLATDDAYLKAEGLKTDSIRAVIPISGVYRLPGRALQSVFGSDPEQRKNAFPMAHLHKGLPPFLILYAENDYPTCGKGPSETFCKALKEKDCEAATREIKDASHLTIVLRAGRPGPTAEAILGFINAHPGR
jgi:arylformamidase